jgi:hypothetical protein
MKMSNQRTMKTFSKISMGIRRTRIVVMAVIYGFYASAFAGAPIHNDTVWKDNRSQEIMCQGGSLCRFGDNYYRAFSAGNNAAYWDFLRTFGAQ